MHISPIEFSYSNSDRKINFKQLNILGDNTKEILKPVIKELETISDGYNVTIKCTDSAACNISQKRLRIEITDALKQDNPYFSDLKNPLQEFLFSKFGVKNPETISHVLIKSYKDEVAGSYPNGLKIIEKVIKENTPDDICKETVDTLTKLVKDHKQKFDEQIKKLQNMWIFSDKYFAKLLRKRMGMPV